jgi:hypothetical protein
MTEDEIVIHERRTGVPPISKEEQAQIVERAIQSWMDKKFSIFGKFTFYGVAIAGFGLLCRFLFTHGWSGPT